jgi:hypothetical protein
MWLVDARPGKEWRRVTYPGQPPHLDVHVRFASARDGVAVTGIQAERNDGHAITARDLRLVKLPPWYVVAGEATGNWFQLAGVPVARSRRGPKDESDEKHHMVWSLWCQAQRIAPQAPVRWMLPRLYVSDATARRWIHKARSRAAELGWEDPTQPQETPGPPTEPQGP